MTKSEIGEIWRWRHPSPGYPSEFKVRVNPQHGSISRQIARWKETKPGAIYTYPNKAVCRDYIIPAKYYNRTAKLIGVPRRKTHRTAKQLAHDKRMAEINEKTRYSGMRTNQINR